MQGQQILITEDDATVRKVLSMTLKRKGFVVWEAGNVTQALESVLRQKPDLMLLDMNLPGGTGFDVLQKVRLLFDAASLPIIVISALSQESNIARGYQLGAQDYLVKPFSMPELMLVLQRYLA